MQQQTFNNLSKHEQPHSACGHRTQLIAIYPAQLGSLVQPSS